MKYRLGDICDIKVGYPFKSENFNEKGDGVRLVRGMNVSKNGFRWGNQTRWWKDISEDLKQYYLEEDDVLIAMDGNVTTNFILVDKKELPLLLVQRVARLRATKVPQKFLWYIIKSYEFGAYLGAVKTGTTISHISAKQIADYEVELPTMEIQKKIVSILASLDNQIKNNNEINDNLSDYKLIESTSISPDISLGRRESLNSSSLILSSTFADNFKYSGFNNSAKGINSPRLIGNNNSYEGRASLLKCKTVVPLTYPKQCSLKRLSCNIPPIRNFEKSNLGRTLTRSIEKIIFLYLDLVNKTSALPITSAFCVKSVCATSVSNNSATCCDFNFGDGSISLNPSILKPPFLSKFFMVAIANSELSTNSEPLYEYPPIKEAMSDNFTFSHPEIWSSGEYGRKCVIAV